MIITDPKKLSMPQQVQKNKEDIEDIRKIIDGLDVEDNVVVVNNISQILTAEELEAIKQPVAFIVYNNHLYFKNKTTSTTAYFDVVFSISGSTVITFESSEIQVGLSNGALGIVNSSVSTYSKTEIDTKLSEKADKDYLDNGFLKLSGGTLTGPFSGPSIIEIMNGYSFTKEGSGDGFDIEYIYAGASKTGNKLTLVVAFNITKTSDADYHKVIGSYTIPGDVFNRLYPTTIDGRAILDIKVAGAFETQQSFISIPYGFEKRTNNVALRLYNARGLLTTNTKYFIRAECTLLLSDNLAD